LIVAAIVGIAVVLVAATSKAYRIPSSSMEPTLHCPRDPSGETPLCLGEEADRILVSRVEYRIRDPKRGDVVAYELPAPGAARCGSPEGSTFVHRIVAVPGDSFRIVRGIVHVDGSPLQETYVEATRRSDETRPARTVPPERYVVLGDNRRASCDSRVWGYLDRDRIIGPKLATYWPVDRISIR
jgi:signal peptidase I